MARYPIREVDAGHHDDKWEYVIYEWLTRPSLFATNVFRKGTPSEVGFDSRYQTNADFFKSLEEARAAVPDLVKEKEAEGK